MKKELKSKKVQKLSLSRETVRQLSEPDLTAVAGGLTKVGCTVELCTGISCYC